MSEYSKSDVFGLGIERKGQQGQEGQPLPTGFSLDSWCARHGCTVYRTVSSKARNLWKIFPVIPSEKPVIRENWDKLSIYFSISICKKKPLGTWQNWSFGQFHHSKIAITCSDMNCISLLIHKIPLICYANRVASIQWVKLLLWIRSHIQPHL